MEARTCVHTYRQAGHMAAVPRRPAAARARTAADTTCSCPQLPSQAQTMHASVNTDVVFRTGALCRTSSGARRCGWAVQRLAACRIMCCTPRGPEVATWMRKLSCWTRLDAACWGAGGGGRAPWEARTAPPPGGSTASASEPRSAQRNKVRQGVQQVGVAPHPSVVVLASHQSRGPQAVLPAACSGLASIGTAAAGL